MMNILKYDDVGPGLPVVLIHGFPLNRKMWGPQIEVLTNAGYRVICLDLPGFGESPAIESASMSAYADAVVGLLDALGIDKAVVGGMSMGGYVLLNLAKRYPQRLLGSLYMVTRAAADDAAGKEKRSMLASEVMSGNHLIVPETFTQVLFAPKTLQENPDLVEEVRRMMESAPPQGVVGGLHAMRDREDFVAKLTKLSLPSLVIGAEQDLAVPLEHAQALVEGLPTAELKVISGAGHMANLEQPDKFNEALLSFLSGFH